MSPPILPLLPELQFHGFAAVPLRLFIFQVCSPTAHHLLLASGRIPQEPEEGQVRLHALPRAVGGSAEVPRCLPARAPGARGILVSLRVLKLHLLGWQRGTSLRASRRDTRSSPDQRSTMEVQPSLGSESVSPAPGLPGRERVGSWLCPGAVPWVEEGASNHSLASPGAARVVGSGIEPPLLPCPALEGG